MAVGGHAAATQPGSAVANRATGNLSYAQVAKQSNVPQATLQPAEPVADRPVAAADRMAMDDMAADQGDGGEIVAPEDLGPKAIGLRLLGIERKLEKRRKQLARDEQAISEQESAIAEQQAILVQLNANADNTREQIRGFNDDRAELSQRLARINATEQDRLAAPSTEVEATPEATAMDCLSRTFLGLQNFETQTPAVKTMLLQFAQAVQAMQAAQTSAAPQGQQLTIQQAFANTAGTNSPQQGGVALVQTKSVLPVVPAEQPGALAAHIGGVQQFDISDVAPPTPVRDDAARGEKLYGPISTVMLTDAEQIQQSRPARQGISALFADVHSAPKDKPGGKDVAMEGDGEINADEPVPGAVSSSELADQSSMDQQDALTDCLFKQGLQHWQKAKKGRVNPY